VTDTGRQRPANEDSLLARSPLFVVADGMGGAQAGEVASRIAVESFQSGLNDTSQPELELATIAQAANARIHELSRANSEQAGMGTTLTAVYVGEQEVAIAHVGDSRAYCLRDGQLMRLTDDHSLVDELLRQGRLTPEEAIEHPQRSVITRALGPEDAVDVDTRSFRGRAHDVFLLCSDGLTTMLPEPEIEAVLVAHPRLHDAGEALIAAANQAGGRDNITVVLVRLEEVEPAPGAPAAERPTVVGMPAVESQTTVVASRPKSTGSAPTALASPPSSMRSAPTALASPPRPVARRTPRVASLPPGRGGRGRSRPAVRRTGVLVSIVVVLGLLGSAGYLALQSVYFIGTNSRGLITLYQGVPYKLPANLALYSSQYVSGVSASALSAPKRHTLLNHSLRSEANAANLIHSLELGQLE
jgi:PPM family protein phosphatase